MRDDGIGADADAAPTTDGGCHSRPARAEVERLVATGYRRGDAARRVAAATGIPRRQLYEVDAGS